MKRNSEYDPFAWLYSRYWGDEFHAQSLQVVERLLLHRLPRGASVLDLCCGDGRMSQQLARRGFTVTGLDSSEAMLAFARRRVPKVTFLLADARNFKLTPQFDAAVSTFDSLNHVRSGRDLRRVFRNVFAALRSGGVFGFDLNREDAYTDLWARNSQTVERDVVSVARGTYSSATRLAHCDVTQFRRLGAAWERSDFRLSQKFHPDREVVAALEAAGFMVEKFDAAIDLGMTGDIGRGRTFYRGSKA